MAEGLRDRLIGAWKLVSYQEIPIDGSDPFEPLGHEPHGIIMNTGRVHVRTALQARPSTLRLRGLVRRLSRGIHARGDLLHRLLGAVSR